MRGYYQAQREVQRAEAFIDLTVAEVKAPGEPAHIGYWTDETVDAGHVIETSTGRRYLVMDCRRTGGRNPHWECETIVMHPEEALPAGAVVHYLEWFPRKARTLRGVHDV